jgi:hypothetical protein
MGREIVVEFRAHSPSTDRLFARVLAARRERDATAMRPYSAIQMFKRQHGN